MLTCFYFPFGDSPLDDSQSVSQTASTPGQSGRKKHRNIYRWSSSGLPSLISWWRFTADARSVEAWMLDLVVAPGQSFIWRLIVVNRSSESLDGPGADSVQGCPRRGPYATLLDLTEFTLFPVALGTSCPPEFAIDLRVWAIKCSDNHMEAQLHHGNTRDDSKLSPGKNIFKTQFTYVWGWEGAVVVAVQGGLCLLCRILSHKVKRRELGSPCVHWEGHYHVLWWTSLSPKEKNVTLFI